ncbi:MAG: hypothetical protein ACOY3X_00065 [Pseudomonadota bacterium]
MSLSDDSQQLRQLARAVMAGELTRDEYRRQRRAVVDRYAGDAPVTALPLSSVVESSPRPGAEPTMPNTVSTPTVPYKHPGDDITLMAGDRKPAGASAPVREEAPAATSGGHDLWIGVAAVAVVLLVLGGLLAIFW